MTDEQKERIKARKKARYEKVATVTAIINSLPIEAMHKKDETAFGRNYVWLPHPTLWCLIPPNELERIFELPSVRRWVYADKDIQAEADMVGEKDIINVHDLVMLCPTYIAIMEACCMYGMLNPTHDEVSAGIKVVSYFRSKGL